MARRSDLEEYPLGIDADGLGDRGTADLFTEVSRGIDKWLWLVEAHLQPGS